MTVRGEVKRDAEKCYEVLDKFMAEVYPNSKHANALSMRWVMRFALYMKYSSNDVFTWRMNELIKMIENEKKAD